jgi:hypothetical protein
LQRARQNFVCAWTDKTLTDLKDEIARIVPEGLLRNEALARLDPRLRPPSAATGSDEAAIDA